jgi:ATP-dependent DNA helicase RecQ
VFHDTTLAEIARQLPQSAVQLRGIAGVGAAKLGRYGVALLELVRQYAQA